MLSIEVINNEIINNEINDYNNYNNYARFTVLITNCYSQNLC